MSGKTTKPATVRRGKAPKGTPTVVLRAGGERFVIRLYHAPVVIGRGDEADVRIDDEGLSRVHARLAMATDGLVHVMDLDSTNGTFVNQARTDLEVLRDGDRLRLGPDVSGRFSYSVQAVEEAPVDERLTSRQLEVACLVAQGLTSAKIAERLGLSTRTVTSHLDRIYERLEISSRAALARRVTAAGLVDPET